MECLKNYVNKKEVQDDAMPAASVVVEIENNGATGPAVEPCPQHAEVPANSK